VITTQEVSNSANLRTGVWTIDVFTRGAMVDLSLESGPKYEAGREIGENINSNFKSDWWYVLAGPGLIFYY